MFGAVIGEGVVEEIFRSGNQLRIIQAQTQRRMPGRRGHRVDVTIFRKAGMAVVIEDGDLANLPQQAIVGLLVAGGHIRAGLPP